MKGAGGTAVLALALLLGGCRQDSPHAAGATPSVPTEAPRTTATDPFAVPAVIDMAYVNRVLAALDAANGDAFRLFLTERQFTPEVADRVRALYGTGERADLTRRSYEGALATSPARPGNRVTTATKAISMSSSCIFVEATRDFRPVGGTDAAVVLWVGLERVTQFSDPAHYNPTPWRYTVDGVMPDRSQPPNPCRAS